MKLAGSDPDSEQFDNDKYLKSRPMVSHSIKRVVNLSTKGCNTYFRLVSVYSVAGIVPDRTL